MVQVMRELCAEAGCSHPPAPPFPSLEAGAVARAQICTCAGALAPGRPPPHLYLVRVLEKVASNEVALVLHAVHPRIVLQHAHAPLVNLHRHHPPAGQRKLQQGREAGWATGLGKVHGCVCTCNGRQANVRWIAAQQQDDSNTDTHQSNSAMLSAGAADDRGAPHRVQSRAVCQGCREPANLDDVAASAREGVAGHAAWPQRLDCRQGKQGPGLGKSYHRGAWFWQAVEQAAQPRQRQVALLPAAPRCGQLNQRLPTAAAVPDLRAARGAPR